MENRIKKIIETLDENKAESIEKIDLHGKAYLVDTVIICTALNNKHSFALLSHIKDIGEEIVRTEEDGDWIIIDTGDIIIHIMTQSHRDLYNIEDFLSSLKKPKED